LSSFVMFSFSTVASKSASVIPVLAVLVFAKMGEVGLLFDVGMGEVGLLADVGVGEVGFLLADEGVGEVGLLADVGGEVGLLVDVVEDGRTGVGEAGGEVAAVEVVGAGEPGVAWISEGVDTELDILVEVVEVFSCV
jgi:hypothetical protein